MSHELITTDMVRNFCKRARGYMLAYIVSNAKDGAVTQRTDITHTMIEKTKKVTSSHHAALDFDVDF
jgi:hypothetical protein